MCTTFKARGEQIGRTYRSVFTEGSSPTPAEAVKPYSELLSLAEEDRRQLSAISPPTEDQSGYTEMLTGLGESGQRTVYGGRRGRAGDQEHLKTVEAEVNSAGSARSQRLNPDFTSLGLVECVDTANQR